MAETKPPSLAGMLRPDLPDHEQVGNLRNIKNYITGHELRKRQYVQDGLIPALAGIVEHINTQTLQSERPGADHSEIWIQVANITCVLAHGGPKFVHSILQSTLLFGLIARLADGLHSKQSLVILNALNAIADNLPLSAPNSWNVDRSLAEHLYLRKTRIDFVRLLVQGSQNHVSEQIFEATAALICKTCTADRHRTVLVDGGVLAVLCKRLVSFVVMQGLVIPQQSGKADNSILSQPATSYTQLSSTLETIATLIEGSKKRSLLFMSDASISQVLPNDLSNTQAGENQETTWATQPSPSIPSALDQFLPNVPTSDIEDPREKSSFPPLGTAVPPARRRQSSIRPSIASSSVMPIEDHPEDEKEHLIVPWLLYVVRTRRGKDRLIASRLLAILHAHGLVKAIRARTFGPLLIPILIHMLEDQKSNSVANPFLLTSMHYSQAVPAVLSSLIQDDSEMQRIAFEAKAIPRLAVALKSTFEQVDNCSAQLWVPNKLSDAANLISSAGKDLGLGGPLLEARHIMTFREGLLRALAAIAPSDDTYRKEICDQGALVQIMLALEPFQIQDKPQQPSDGPNLTNGNSTSTLLAACNAVRALTRSVTALRTKLVDADVGKAVMKLMYNPDPEVRIAATKVIANLAMDFSPLKATISEPDLVKKLCEQAHSANARLRLESVWALKLLVLNAPNKLKRDVIDELGSNWIKHLIETDPYNIPPGVVIGLSERDYPPRTAQNVGNAAEDTVMDDELRAESQLMETSSGLHDSAEHYNKHTVEDDLAIQEQLLDLIRNLFCGKAASEIIDYLLGEIGHDMFIKVLIDRLKPRFSSSTARYANTKPPASQGVIVKVLYVIVHMAASAPKFRNMISANSTLLRSIAGFCSHEDPEVRVQCCWVIINLTFEDDSSDREACRMRALDIQKAGFQGLMRRLESDLEPNVRERAKTAVHLLLKMM